MLGPFPVDVSCTLTSLNSTYPTVLSVSHSTVSWVGFLCWHRFSSSPDFIVYCDHSLYSWSFTGNLNDWSSYTLHSRQKHRKVSVWSHLILYVSFTPLSQSLIYVENSLQIDTSFRPTSDYWSPRHQNKLRPRRTYTFSFFLINYHIRTSLH